MSNSSIGLSDELNAYVLDHTTDPHPVQQHLIERTTALGQVAGMQISPEQGQFLTMMTATLNVSFAVEVGTFTGYSALAIARGLAPEGRLLCCDVSEEWTSIGATAWAEAGLSDRIDLVIAPAIETLRALPDTPTVDLAFIDADKGSYIDYYEQLLPRLSPNGLLFVDNTLWSGLVLDATDTSDSTVAIRAFNTHVANDPRSSQVIIPIGDGLTMISRN